MRNGTLYSTTFPCHECAKHIVASGISRVVYIEPYPKSKAADFYPQAFGENTEERDTPERGIGIAEPFVGVGPRKYRDLFSLTSGEGGEISRKNAEGDVERWEGRTAELRWRTWSVSYLDAEPWYVRKVITELDKLRLRSIKRK